MDFAGRFGRQIFKLYEKYPLTLNTLVGGTVYVGGELITQIASHRSNDDDPSQRVSMVDPLCDWRRDFNFSLEHVDWNRIAGIGVLGSVENGVFMLAWYRLA